MSQATAKFTAILTDNLATADYTKVWPNTVRADAAIVFLRDFFIENSTENGDFYWLVGGKVSRRTWNDVYHVRQQNEQSLEAQFIQMFNELSAFLLAQTSDDLCLMTLRTAIARYQLSLATDLVKTAHWSALASRLYPLMKNY